MTHRKNRDLKAELGEARIAAQNWEDKFIEASEALAGEQHELRVMHDSHALIMLKNLELRNELGQASRELMAASQQLTRLKEIVQKTDESVSRAPDGRAGVYMAAMGYARLSDELQSPITPEGDTSESEAMERELGQVLIELRDDLNESDDFEVTQP